MIRRYFRNKLYEHKKQQKIASSLYQKYCRMTGFLHTLPDFLIIGFVKCGTTSLYEYLLQHPDIYSPTGKEIDYFDRLYSRKIDWYKVNFPLKTKKFYVKNIVEKNFLSGEATPRYIEHPHALTRIKKVIPKAKFIVLLRNPVNRAYSHYNQNVDNQYEYLSFDKAIEKENHRIKNRYEKMEKNENFYSWDYDLFGYVEHGIYMNKLERWLKVFPREQFLILQTEEFLKNPSLVYNNVLHFLNLPRWEPLEYKLYKKREYKQPKMNPEIKKKLIEFYKPYNEKLYKLLETRFDWNE